MTNLEPSREQVQQIIALQKQLPDLKQAIDKLGRAGVDVSTMKAELTDAEDRIKKFINVYGPAALRST